MNLTLSLLPLYVVGNLHCFGMCGPLVMMIAHNPNRFYYYLGRISSFSLAGGLAGAFGFLFKGVLGDLSGYFSLSLGLILILLSISQIYPIRIPGLDKIGGGSLVHLMMRDSPSSVFLFGFSTVFLPCGQSLIVFATLALSESFLLGLTNGLIFSLLTTPSLLFAMNLKKWASSHRTWPKWIAFLTGFLIGVVACNRGLSDLGLIPHFSLSENYHIILW